MKKLSQLLQNIDIITKIGDDTKEINTLSFDSREAVEGMLFFALVGESVDGHKYIESAIDKGVSAIVCQELPEDIKENVCYIKVENSNIALGRIAAEFYDHPSKKLKLVGVTGTNGKTTTATLLYDLFRKLGYKAGLLSTVIYKIDNESIASTHTTPDAIRINKMLATMTERGCDYCFMEVSSHSLVQHRTEALEFAGGIFTNITHDHLDYHKTFKNYINAKKMFFDALGKNAFALSNEDDKNGAIVLQNTKAKKLFYSLEQFSDYRCEIVEMHFDGMLINIDGNELWIRFLGRFNAYNLLTVYASALELGQDKIEVLTALSSLTSVKGRFEYITNGKGLTAIVDYAHTPDALQNVIDTINEIRNFDTQQLIVVVGCGGNRDATKRPVMAKIAGDNADLTILTSDNPRFEDPDEILKQMREGIDPSKRHIVISDRREAIKTAIMMAKPTDIVLVAGKGHENYQDIKGVKHHFDDKEEIEKIFETL